jgi:hypothetical protein
LVAAVSSGPNWTIPILILTKEYREDWVSLLCPGEDSDPGSATYKARLLTTRLWHSVTIYFQP